MLRRSLLSWPAACLCTASLAFVALDGSAADTRPPPPSDPVAPVPRDRDYSWMSLSAWFTKHAEDVAIASAGNIDLLFVGDSITEGATWSDSWKQAFGAYRSANFAIGGDRTQNVLWRLEHGAIGKLEPKVVVLLIGTNNLYATQDDVADTERGVLAVVAKLRGAFPASKLVVLGIFPRDAKADAPVREKVKCVNAALASLDDGKQLLVRDLGAIFLEPDGSLAPAVAPDALHLSEEGYRRWSGALAPIVAELMK